MIIERDFDTSADIWSAGCIAFELATGKTLFKAKKDDGWTKAQDHLRNIAIHLGPIPKAVALSGKRSKGFVFVINQLNISVDRILQRGRISERT